MLAVRVNRLAVAAPKTAILLFIDAARYLCAVATVGTLGAAALFGAPAPRSFRNRLSMAAAGTLSLVLSSAVIGLWAGHGRPVLLAASVLLGPVGGIGVWLHAEWLALSVLLIGDITAPAIAKRETALLTGMFGAVGLGFALRALLTRLRVFVLRQTSAIGRWRIDAFTAIVALALAGAVAGAVALLAIRSAAEGIGLLLAASSVPESLAGKPASSAIVLIVLCAACAAVGLWRHAHACRAAYR